MNLCKKSASLLKYVAIAAILYFLVKYDFNILIIAKVLFSGDEQSSTSWNKNVAVDVKLNIFSNKDGQRVESSELYVENQRRVTEDSEEIESLIDFYNFKLDLVNVKHTRAKESTIATAGNSTVSKQVELPPCTFVPHGLGKFLIIWFHESDFDLTHRLVI